jgi:p-hydroxybenzoate 3-monooxygenase
MTTMLHRNDQAPAFQHKIHMADLDLIRTNRATAQAVAENYVGLPFDD